MNYKEDNKYLEIVDDILSNDEFKSLKNYKHHGINRYDHCINVSYASYKHAIKHKYKTYKEVTRAAILHDFFLINNQEISIIKRISVLFTHPRTALETSRKYFKLTKLEENIILTHMFPLGIRIPKYKESWLVCWIDDVLSIKERILSIFKKN